MNATTVTIDGTPVGAGHPPFLIAELSGNHNGSLARALALIDAAADAGADAVKLQTYTADGITLDADGPLFRIADGPWAGRRLHDLYREAATPWEWHEALFARARARGLAAFSAPFDFAAVDFLETLGAPAYKVASFELVDLPLIRHIAATGRPMLLSTGLASEAEIADALDAARAGGAAAVILLHCVSGYPTPPEDAGICAIPHLAKRFGAPAGLSDHTLGAAVAVAAVALGAVAIEKHLTLTRSDGGPDSAFSLELPEFTALARDCRTAWVATRRPPSDAPAPSEVANAAFRRSLFVVADIAAGGALTTENVRSIRPGYGLAPKFLPEVLGRRVARPIARGTPLAWDLIAQDV